MEVFTDVPLIRINAPEIYADPAFQEWFFGPRPNSLSLATWHSSQMQQFADDSDMFLYLTGYGPGDDIAGSAGDADDMPEHIWRQLLGACAEALDAKGHYECLVWLTNQATRPKSATGRLVPTPSPFGTGIDEMLTQDAMVEIVGGTAKADRLMYLFNNSYPLGSAYDRLYGRSKTKSEVFRSKAQAEGFTDRQIDAFLTVVGG